MQNSYDVSRDTITVDGVQYDIERIEDRGHPETTLKIRDFDIDEGDWVYPFDGLEGHLGYMDSGEGFNPREDTDCNIGVMFCEHPRYNLGDKDADDPRDHIKECPDCEGEGITNLGRCPKCDGDGELPLPIEDYLKQEHGARVVIPLFLYDHSGISMSAGTAVYTTEEAGLNFSRKNRVIGDDHGWDVSSVGVIYDTKDTRKHLGENPTNEQTEKALRSEIQQYSAYLEGDITWYGVNDEETNFSESCCGYVGCHEEAERECFDSLMRAIERRQIESKERAEWAARDTITV